MFVQDESRWTPTTITRRRITARGVKPEGVHCISKHFCWLYGGFDPLAGDAFFVLLPELNAVCMQRFLDHFAAAYPESFNILVLDRAGAHTAHTLRIPPNIGVLFFPTACPELNPAERVWHDLRSKLAWLQFGHSELLEDELIARVREYDHEVVRSVTQYPYLMNAILAL